jgi:phosphomannomutase/phosphomannomutase/phosphoglucomutase
MDFDCFKAYDIRGRLPDEINENIAYRIGRAYAQFLKPGKVAVGRDVRLTSDALCRALSRGLTDSGADVLDIGLCGTEEIYFATFHHRVDGGIMVTASHNPMDYNGMKLVREGSRPISGDSGLKDIRDLAAREDFTAPTKKGVITRLEDKAPYIEHLLGYVDTARLRPLKVVVNAGNGCAGPVIDLLERRLPFTFIKVHHEPDGAFPNGIPNPLLPENRDATARAVVEHRADMGIAWDGDFDRCFLFDEQGRFIEGYYIVGLLAEAMLSHHPGSRIIHDPRLTWNTIEMVREAGGIPVMSKTGHAFIKERMRLEDAVYGGEMSAHHYFRDFAYCDSGMIPWLLVAELVGATGRSLSSLVGERIGLYPASGEINRRLADPAATLAHIQDHFRAGCRSIDFTDGLSMEFDGWRFNLRCSNTEPVVRLNVESRGDQALMEEKTREILALMD